MNTMLKSLWRHDSGDDVAEYALLLAMIALVVLVAVYSFGTSNGKRISDTATSLSSSSSGGGAGGSSGGQGGGTGQRRRGRPVRRWWSGWLWLKYKWRFRRKWWSGWQRADEPCAGP